MPSKFLDDHCTFVSYDHPDVRQCNSFDCNHSDLNDFFQNDSSNYSAQLLGKTYCFTLDEDPKTIVAAFTISNDSIKASLLPRKPKKTLTKNIPREKTMRSYPAVLIGRLGVNSDFSRNGVGGEVLDFIKSWFIQKNNKTGCRFIVVDAYNEARPINFYIKNGFEFLFRNEDEEKTYLGSRDKPGEELSLKTRLMYFDLITIDAPQ